MKGLCDRLNKAESPSQVHDLLNEGLGYQNVSSKTMQRWNSIAARKGKEFINALKEAHKKGDKKDVHK